MSFSGVKYRRVRCENVEECMKVANASEEAIRMLKSCAPVFSFIKIDEQTFSFNLQSPNRTMTHTFKLGEEHEMERRDGSKVNVTYTLEGDNILHQVIKQPDGKVAHFKREFEEKQAKMTVTVDGADVQAHIYYEVIQ